ncbi:MAG: glycosyltransferase [bacterium]
MNIAFVNSADSWGGGEKWTLRTALELSRRGHKIVLVGREGSLFADRVARSGLLNHTLPFSFDYHPATIPRLMRLFREHRTEVVVVHFNKDVRTAGVAAKLLGIPVVHRNGFPILHNNLRHWITARFIDRILTNSERIRETYSRYGWLRRIPTDVVPNGLEVPASPGKHNPVRLGFRSKNLVAAYVGRLTTVKRVVDLLNAFAVLPETSPWRLAVLGSGSEESTLRNRVAGDPTLSERVHFHGFVESAAELAGCSDIVLLPSEDEGMPNALMEAMARGVPVAASPVGDVPLLLDHGRAGFLVPLRDPGAWTSLLLELETDSKRRRATGNAGRKRILEQFTLEAMIDGVEACLSSATHGR